MRPALAKPFHSETWLYAKLALTSLIDRVELAWKRTHSQPDPQNAPALCLFIGYPRSGHSLVSSLLDAHPQALIAHRLNLVKYIAAGYNMRELLYLVTRNSQRFARAGHTFAAYKYAVPASWQGHATDPKMIGDQEGRTTVKRLARDPALLERLQQFGTGRRFIHVIRNPYDNIASWSIRAHMSVARSVRHYFELCAAVATVKARVPTQEVIDVRHEDMLADVDGSLDRLCSFLNLEISPDYLRACRQIAFLFPHRTRYFVVWTPQLHREVREGIARFDFLHGYTYQS